MSDKTRNFHYLLHSADLVEQHLRKQLAPLGLGPRQARILDAISLLEPVSQVRLARVFNITAASMSTMTTRLITAGLIQREVNPKEARGNLLRLTGPGRECIARIEEVWDGIDQMIAQTIGQADTERLTEVTLALRNALGGRDPDHG